MKSRCALSVTQRALSVTQRALSVTQRALSVTQRALRVTQRALSSCTRFTHRWLSRWDSCLLAPLPWVLGTVHHLRVETGPVCGGGTGHDPVMFDSRTLLETVGGERDRCEWVLDLSQADDAYLPLSFEPSLPASRVRRKICEGQAAEQADGP
jgi:hypothetical protein